MAFSLIIPFTATNATLTSKMRFALSVAILFTFSPIPGRAAFNLIAEYSGANFFSGWDYFDNYDNLTGGATNWVDQATADSSNLTYINSAGNAVIKVDNASFVPYPDKRNAARVRITTQDLFPIGSVFVTDVSHIPYGCSVWPGLWTKGANWPNDGEIDIIEGVNLMTSNQMTLHGTNGCMKTTPSTQTSQTISTNCSVVSGCSVLESAPNSYGEGFATAGGGVWATQFDVAVNDYVVSAIKSSGIHHVCDELDRYICLGKSVSELAVLHFLRPATICYRYYDVRKLVSSTLLERSPRDSFGMQGWRAIYLSATMRRRWNCRFLLRQQRHQCRLSQLRQRWFEISYIKVFSANGTAPITTSNATSSTSVTNSPIGSAETGAGTSSAGGTPTGASKSSALSRWDHLNTFVVIIGAAMLSRVVYVFL
ncbi:putative glycosidase C21B10.07 [Grifola frondosa]|uniref:Putative glycosidase C21B10.07 n=1 Tax=Grifola frondosa TaxID=5627 RepID=A0A1C7MBT8_GRIFR|nr:putative glycosidase C21B10.07 [Grifola frondosa]